jgi:hypothetical protein
MEDQRRVKDFNRYITTYQATLETYDAGVLRRALACLVEHHDAFRLAFAVTEDGTPVQTYQDNSLEIKVYELNTAGLSAEEGKEKTNREIHTIFDTIDIFNGPLFAFLAVHGGGDSSALVYLFAHHLTTDGVSLRIVGHDFVTIYDYLLASKEETAAIAVRDILGPKSTSCRQWITTLGEYKPLVEKERAYWEAAISATEQSNRKITALRREGKPALYTTKLDEGVTSQILKIARQGRETPIDDILLSGVTAALSNLTGPGENVIFMESHGRQEFLPDVDISRTMGWFASPYPLMLPQAKDKISCLIAEVKKTLRKVPNEGIGFKALFLDEERGAELPVVYFNYQGEFEDDAGRLGIELENPADIYRSFILELTACIIGNRLELGLFTALEPRYARLFMDVLERTLGLVVTELDKR